MADTRHKHQHLKRLPQVWISDPVYFITTCTKNRRAILACGPVADILIQTWHESLSRYGWMVGSYVVMPDHVHFFCAPTSKAVPLSRFVGQWKEWTSKRMVQVLGYSVPIWQREFFDHVLRSKESRSEKWAYVRENPVRANLVACAEEWQYQGSVDFD
ncbi:MAG: transposase [Planctomycetota bacterium]